MNLLASVVARARSLFRRGPEDAKTEDELRFHLEMETEKNLRAGMSPRDPLVWAGVLLLIVGVTAAAHVEPARRILRIDLTRALHAE